MFKILVVDDEKSIREVIRTYAEFEGHEVVEAVDGLDAIDKVKEEDFDVIVMDIMMPRLDGFSSYKEIKKIKNIPVLMLSARSEEFEGLKIDLDGRVVFVDDEMIDLTPKEYDLLVYMVKNKNIALSRDKLLNQVWGYDFYGEDRTVDTHIKMLRNSIKEYRKFIITVRGVGYKFDTRN